MESIPSSARAVTTYVGRFPVRHVGFLVIADDGARSPIRFAVIR